MNAPTQNLGTSDTVAVSRTRVAAPARPSSLLAVVAAVPRTWLLAAGVTAAVALVSTTHDRVPIASGLAVAVLTIAALVDVSERRLPDLVVISSAVVFVVCLAVERAAGHTVVGLFGPALGVAAFAGPLLALHLIAPASMGFGDVKAAVVLGAAVGAVDWQLALAGLAIAAGLTATVGIVRRASTIAFGPGLVAASAIVLAAHPLFLTPDAGTDALPTIDPPAVGGPHRGDTQ